ncbi:laccase domain-containing protein [Candidatus Saccharibacteria bacterium]|nr:laccase domain-containing protein [Candidatus Saccharibacteria bacterium]
MSNSSSSQSRYNQNQFVTFLNRSDCKIVGTRGSTNYDQLCQAVRLNKELLPGNLSVSDKILGSVYDACAEYAKQYDIHFKIPREVFIAGAMSDAQWRLDKLREMSKNWFRKDSLPEFFMSLNNKKDEGGEHPAHIYTLPADHYSTIKADGAISYRKGTSIRLNIADCPSIFMIESTGDKTTAISAWHLGYAPVGHGMGESFINHAMSSKSDKHIFLTPGIKDIRIYGDAAANFSPPDRAFWQFAAKNDGGSIDVWLAAYVRSLAERVGAEIINPGDTEDTASSNYLYSHRTANDALKANPIDPLAKVNGRNGYIIAWQ